MSAKLILAALSCIPALCGVACATTTSSSVNIRASIAGNGTCSLQSVPSPTINSTTLALAGGDLTTNASLSVECTDGVSPYRLYALMSTNANDAVQRRLKFTGTPLAFLNYDIYTDANYTTRWPTSFAAGIDGQDLSRTYQMYIKVPSQSASQTGAWTDQVTFEITY